MAITVNPQTPPDLSYSQTGNINDSWTVQQLSSVNGMGNDGGQVYV